MGKRDLIAKGIRKTTSRKAGHLELFTHVSMLVAQARTWDIVTEATAVESFRHLREDLDSISCAAYVAELVDVFGEASDDSRNLWDLLLLALRRTRRSRSRSLSSAALVRVAPAQPGRLPARTLQLPGLRQAT
ncbi:MAG: DNA repair protein RecO [Caldilineaceae bacterium]